MARLSEWGVSFRSFGILEFLLICAGKGFFHPENVGSNTVAKHLPLELVGVLNALQVSPTGEDLARRRLKEWD